MESDSYSDLEKIFPGIMKRSQEVIISKTNLNGKRESKKVIIADLIPFSLGWYLEFYN